MSTQDKDFVHLHVHSDFSLLDGCCRMDRLMERAVELGMSAMALTDHGNLFGTVSFVKQAEKHGIKPIIGCEGYLVTDHKNDEKPGRENHKSYHLGLLAKNYEGYRNLSKVVSDAHVVTVFITDPEQTSRLWPSMPRVSSVSPDACRVGFLN